MTTFTFREADFLALLERARLPMPAASDAILFGLRGCSPGAGAGAARAARHQLTAAPV